jgi:hypothetical protein
MLPDPEPPLHRSNHQYAEFSVIFHALSYHYSGDISIGLFWLACKIPLHLRAVLIPVRLQPLDLAVGYIHLGDCPLGGIKPRAAFLAHALPEYFRAAYWG